MNLIGVRNRYDLLCNLKSKPTQNQFTDYLKNRHVTGMINCVCA